MKPHLTTYFLSSLCLCFSSGTVHADPAPYLTGDRQWLEDRGLTIESVLTFESVKNSDGGIARDFATLFNYDLTVTADTSKAGLWSNGTFFLYLLGDAGGNPSSFIGDLQVSSNIESPDNIKLYELWYDHSFFENKASILFGLHDYNSEFDQLDAASGLFNSSFGISPEKAQLGVSIFPTTSLALRAKVLPTEQSYVLVGAYDGIPGSPYSEKDAHIKFDSGDGAFLSTELGITGKEDAKVPYKYAIGGWYKSTRYTDYGDTLRNNNAGWYAIMQQSIVREEDDNQGLSLFLQYGWADPTRNEISTYVGGGLQYVGLFPTREEDITSFGIARAAHGNHFGEQFPDSEDAETAFEANHRFEVTPYFAVQPDFQYIMNPGTDETLRDAKVFALRLQLSL